MDGAVPLRAAEQAKLSGRALRILKDEKLAAMVAAGSDDAFAVLYGRHHQPVYRYCLSLLHQEADARDALQSTMLAALSSLRGSAIEGQFKPWLFRIAHNQSISIIRARTREAPTDAPSPLATLDDRESREQLRALVADLGALPDRQRGAIVMREMSGLSYAEIATALGTSEAGGKQLVYEARSALHELREGHELGCELVRQRISADDRRLLRGRKIRAHLRGCEPCHDFELAVRRRRTAFAALAPPLAPLAAASVLQDVLAGGGAGGAGGGAGGSLAALGAPPASAPLAAPALKVVAAALIAGGAGLGAYEVGSAILAEPGTSTAEAVTDAGAPRKPATGDGAGRDPGDAARRKSGADRNGDGADGVAKAGAGSSEAGAGAASESAPSPDTAAPGVSGLAGQEEPGGGSDPGGGAGVSTVEPPQSPSPPTSPAPDPPAPPGAGSEVAPGTPSGHGGIPPGQGGTPPGQAGSTIPPGHLGNPGNGGGA
jgi:RNA polymerase sigma factor (sigma-70 family)